MKTIQEIIGQESVYLNRWTNRLKVIADFEDIYFNKDESLTQGDGRHVEFWKDNQKQVDKALKKYEGVNILFASYGTGNYTGEAWVLFEQNGKLYEVNGDHCSCYGLEGQWKPEEVHLETLVYWLQRGKLGTDEYSGNLFKTELCDFLGLEQN